ncbi:MAG: DUF7380 domain-containing protein [Candidatus Binataceae bacterium]
MNLFDSNGERARADAYFSLAVAYKAVANWREPNAEPGTYFQASGFTGTQQQQEMDFLKKPETLALLLYRSGRTQDPIRKARLADIVWEFARNPDSARIAIDCYARAVQDQVYAGSLDAHLVAAYLARAIALARRLKEGAEIMESFAHLACDALDRIAREKEFLALTLLVNSLLEWRPTPPELLNYADCALMRALGLMPGSRGDNFFARSSILELLRRIANLRKDDARTLLIIGAIGETLVAEAERYSRDPSTVSIAMGYFERAARHFQKIGDRARAEELRVAERNCGRQATYGIFSARIQQDLSPYLKFWSDFFGGKIPSRAERLSFWGRLPDFVPVPTQAHIEDAISAARRLSPLLSEIPVVYIEDELEREGVSAEEGLRRRALYSVHLDHAMRVFALLSAGLTSYGIVAAEAVNALESNGRFDLLAMEMFQRLVNSFDQRDWITLACLAAPLLERIVRAVATEADVETKFQESGGGRIRLNYKSIEVLLREIPIEENLKNYITWLTSDPGRNLRNKVGHGYIHLEECEPLMGVQVVYAAVALAFAKLGSAPSGTAGPSL